MVDAWTNVADKIVIFIQRTGGASMGALTPEMINSFKESNGFISDSVLWANREEGFGVDAGPDE